MSVPVAYATIIIIWSTTPLGIAWSSATVSPVAAISLRMVLAAALGVIVLKLMRVELRWDVAAIRAYLASLTGVYGALMFTYLAAGYVPSGLISVTFALSPVLSNLFASRLLGQGEFTWVRWCAFAISFVGLAIICLDDWVLSGGGWKGITLLLLAVLLYSLSGVLVQRERYTGHPLSMTVGTLVTAAPLFALTWILVDGEVPSIDLESRSIWAIAYLAVFGSILGFVAYFHLVAHLGATSVAMTTLLTPVLALYLGSALNGETLTQNVVYGTAGVLTGLIIYYFGPVARSLARVSRR